MSKPCAGDKKQFKAELGMALGLRGEHIHKQLGSEIEIIDATHTHKEIQKGIVFSAGRGMRAPWRRRPRLA